jgi:hypothetical protein
MAEVKYGEIKIQTIGMDEKNIDRYRQIIQILIERGVFEVVGTRIYLDFDDKKNLMQVKKAEELMWKRKKM